MPFGPIIDAELTRLARQPRWYILRVALGLGLLALLYEAHLETSWVSQPGSGWTDDMRVRFVADAILRTALFGQTFTVFFLAPLLVVGAIAEEKQRKTLHYLLASRLSSFEIVAGKLVARLLLVAMPVLMVAPVAITAAIFGRFPVEFILVVYGATLTTVVFEATLAILVSTLARRGRDAILFMVLFGLAWLAGPVLLQNFLNGLREPWPTIYYRWIEPINAPLIELSPLGLIRPGFSPANMEARVRSMMIHQAVGSVALLALATWALRPAFRSGDGSAKHRPARGRFGRLLARRWRPRPTVGDDAMLWKETHGTPGSRLVAFISLATSLSVVLMGYDSFKTTIPRSWQALRLQGYRLDENDARHILGMELRVVAAGLFAVWSLLMMIASTTSISREREDDTWISLVSTPLSGREILRAKLLGAAWSCRHLAYAILGVIAFGTALGATHPLGALVAVAQLAVFGLFVVAVGTLISIRIRTTSAALGLGVVLLVGLGLLVPMMLGTFAYRPGPWPAVTSQPALLCLGLFTPRNVADIRQYFWSEDDYKRWGMSIREAVFTAAIGSLAYLALGPILLAWAYRRFDRLLDRPRRPPISFAPGHPTSAAPAGAARASLPAGRAG